MKIDYYFYLAEKQFAKKSKTRIDRQAIWAEKCGLLAHPSLDAKIFVKIGQEIRKIKRMIIEGKIDLYVILFDNFSFY